MQDVDDGMITDQSMFEAFIIEKIENLNEIVV